MNLAFVYFNFN